MSWLFGWPFWVTLGLIGTIGLISWREGTWNRQKADLTFWRNWAAGFPGGIIIGLANGIMIPCLRNSMLLYGVGLAAGIFLTGRLYKFWHEEGEANRGHIIYWDQGRGQSERWTEDVTWAGWLQFIFVVLEIMVVVAFFFSPVLFQISLFVGLLFLLLAIIAGLQAHFVQEAYKFSLSAGVVAAIFVLLFIKKTIID